MPHNVPTLSHAHCRPRVGTEKGAPIPIKRNGIVESHQKDENNDGSNYQAQPTGSNVYSRVDQCRCILTVIIPEAVLDFVREELRKQMEKRDSEAKNL